MFIANYVAACYGAMETHLNAAFFPFPFDHTSWTESKFVKCVQAFHSGMTNTTQSSCSSKLLSAHLPLGGSG